MTVKCVRGRRRYIAFSISEDVDKRGLIKLLSDLPQLKIIHCEGGMAVVRCSPADREEVISRIVSEYPGSRSLKTSGTLKGLRRIYKPLNRS